MAPPRTTEELEESIASAKEKLSRLRSLSGRKRVELYDQRSKLDAKDRQLREAFKHKNPKYLYQKEFVGAPPFVVTVQSNLCQKLHWVGIYQHQIGSISKFSRNEVELEEGWMENFGKTDSRMEVLNRIAKQDDVNYKYRMAYLDVIKAQTAIIRKLDLMVQPKFPSNPDNYMHKLSDFLDEEDDDQEDSKDSPTSTVGSYFPKKEKQHDKKLRAPFRPKLDVDIVLF